MATDARGHTVPTGSDFAQRKSLTDLSLSIPSIKSVASKAAATLYLATLSDAGITPSVANPVWAWRSDTQALMRHDGAAWTRISPRKSLAGSALNGGQIAAGKGGTSVGSALTITCDGTEALVAVRANRLHIDGSGAGYVGVRLDGVSVGDERRVYSSWGAFSTYSPDWTWPIAVTPGTHTVAAFVSTDPASANAIYLEGSGIICWNI